MAQPRTVSLADDVDGRLEDELESYGDNRSAIVNEALREYFGMQQEEPADD